MESHMLWRDWVPAGDEWLLALCLVVALTSLPLAVRLVPPNSFYGFRTRFTRSSREAWYAANAFAGWTMLAASVLSALALVAGPAQLANAGIAEAVVFAPMALAMLANFVYLRHLRETAGRR
jgi:uncharacterized membrane protein